MSGWLAGKAGGPTFAELGVQKLNWRAFSDLFKMSSAKIHNFRREKIYTISSSTLGRSMESASIVQSECVSVGWRASMGNFSLKQLPAGSLSEWKQAWSSMGLATWINNVC